MTRYAEAIAEIALRVRLVSPRGVAPIVVPSTEQAVIADAIADAIPDAVRTQPTVDEFREASDAIWVLAGLPDEALLTAFNSFRERAKLRGMLVIVTINHEDWRRFHRAAPDMMSAPAFSEVIPFEPLGADIDAGRRQLAEAYAEQFGRLDLRGLIRREGEDVSWPIEQVYQPARAADDYLRRREKPPIHGTSPIADQLTPEVLARPLVILGHPGAGKSFFLRWCARQATERDMFGYSAPLPVFLPLAAYTASPGQRSLYDYVIDRLLESAPAAAHALSHAITSGQAMFLLDGLDEVSNDHQRKRCVAEVEALRARGPGCPVIITSRMHGYASVRLDDALVVRLAPLSPDEIRAFLTAWCGAYAVERKGEKARDAGEAEGQALADEINDRPALRRLVEVPLLLTVLAIMQRTGVRLPQHRVELYAQIVHVLVERWNQVRSLAGPRGAVPLRTVDAIRLLGPVALSMVESGERVAISGSDLRALLRPTVERGIRGVESVEEVMQLFLGTIGLLVEQAPDRFAFLHLTLLEYFAALELTRTSRLLSWMSERAVQSTMHEIIRLAVAEIGVRRADDRTLRLVVERLCALSLEPEPSLQGIEVAALMGGIVQDEPDLAHEDLARMMSALIPRWWFVEWVRLLSEAPPFGTDFKIEADAVLRNSEASLQAVRSREDVAPALERLVLSTLDEQLSTVFRSLDGFDAAGFCWHMLEVFFRVGVIERAQALPILVRYQARASDLLVWLFDYGPEEGILSTGRRVVEAAVAEGFDAVRVTLDGEPHSPWMTWPQGFRSAEVVRIGEAPMPMLGHILGFELRRAET